MFFITCYFMFLSSLWTYGSFSVYFFLPAFIKALFGYFYFIQCLESLFPVPYSDIFLFILPLLSRNFYFVYTSFSVFFVSRFLSCRKFSIFVFYFRFSFFIFYDEIDSHFFFHLEWTTRRWLSHVTTLFFVFFKTRLTLIYFFISNE